MAISNKFIICIACNEEKRHEAKDMCTKCYQYNKLNGTMRPKNLRSAFCVNHKNIEKYNGRYCKECYNKIRPKKRTEYLHKYGITIEQYNNLSLKNAHNCYICNKPEKNKRLAVDHDHKTGIIRGLLCTKCNHALGVFGDNLEGIYRVVKYLGGLSIFDKTLDISLGFNEIAIKQKKNKVSSRLFVSIESEIIKGVTRPIPIIGANMSTVCNSEYCNTLYKLGAFGILHRAMSNEQIIKEASKLSGNWKAVSIGIGEDQVDLAKTLIDLGINIIVIDVAHGYSDIVFETARQIKRYSSTTKVVLGNTINVSMLYEAHNLADAIKVGIGQGFACDTKNTAGCTEKQFSSVLKFKIASRETGIPIISDGGHRVAADFVKAIGAGANSVMLGKILAACPESAAEIWNLPEGERKVYAGMASEYVQNKWKGGLKEGTCAEGEIKLLPISLPVEEIISHWAGALRSGITYGGGQDIESFQKNVEFIRI